ncbi:2-(3-amino-3-carboxypropyl)histidine synthase subunit 2-like [Camellia sinensis]|uniref:2-(3-amino-3-carboxypropyl)histidine synthase subunit 2 n=1 Tax=Camellia sinensis var. sinensis TaxID=542762 RepID=A0A4S4DS70_CAMSN|nr:2-(3-amino-3-carboxypropyl)histidine synthase subunit 2-like [Camellia sinensis]THG06042.1 hypothetical protein TEA_019409 [Camellia sinensis var. sinensis]
MQVLFGLEYAHAIQDIKEAFTIQSSRPHGSTSKLELYCADVMCSVMDPSENVKTSSWHLGLDASLATDQGSGNTIGTLHSIGGLSWSLPEGRRIEDCLLCWVGADNAAFANVVLTFNGCEIDTGSFRYDAAENRLVTDVSHQRRILKCRYYLVEKAKDANIIGILVGTLGVTGYLHMINQMKELITKAGKKVYTLVMGKPNPAKLANFPECDVFVYVSCAQTALLDSKEFLSPVITPFEAMIAFSSGSQRTGAYVMEFQNLMTSFPMESRDQLEEARFSFLQGGYVEDFEREEISKENEDGTLALVKATEKALQVSSKDPKSIIKGTTKSGAEYLASRSYHGLDIQSHSSLLEPFSIGRIENASGYEDEKSKQESLS